MEFRLLRNAREQTVFAERLAQARARHGAVFKDGGRTHDHNARRLAAADVYALFENECDPIDRMIGGVALHDLGTFTQSCPLPDLSYLPAHAVLECSDHWSLSRGAGMQAWRGIAVQVVHRDPQAVLIYLAVGGTDHAGFYSAMGFRRAGEPVVYPYLEGPDNGRLWVQPMILTEEPLQGLIASVRNLRIEAHDDYRVIRFSKSDRLRPASRCPADGFDEAPTSTAAVTTSDRAAEEAYAPAN